MKTFREQYQDIIDMADVTVAINGCKYNAIQYDACNSNVSGKILDSVKYCIKHEIIYSCDNLSDNVTLECPVCIYKTWFKLYIELIKNPLLY